MALDSAFLVTVMADSANVLELGRRYLLPPEGVTIGNSPEADILIRFESRSPYLFRIYEEDNRWQLLALTDQSLAHKNNLLTQDSTIYDGDVIDIGPFGFEFCAGTGRKVLYFQQMESILQEDFLTRAYNRSFLFNLLNLEVGRYNRKIIERQKEKNLDESASSRLSLIFLDVDNFGLLNKQHGHHIGDEVLRELIKRIKGQLRTIDIVARYGGEEFCVVLLDTPKDQAIIVAENIRKLVSGIPFQMDTDLSLPVTISSGVAELELGMNVDSFVKSADSNMRKAKQQGKNLVIW